MRILICDDDTDIIEKLESYISKYFNSKQYTDFEIISYLCGEDLLNDNGPIDLCFLDIEMIGVDGIFTGRNIHSKFPDALIIIVTSYMEYLDDAMRFKVFRYMNKPIDKARLYKNLDDAIDTYSHNNRKIIFETGSQTITIPLSTLIMVEAQGRKTIVTTTDKKIVSTKSMREWNNLLVADYFYQSHRSYLINLSYVSSFDHAMIHLYHDKVHAYLSKRKYNEFKKKYLLFLEVSV